MADYGVITLDEFGNETFNTVTNAGRGLRMLDVGGFDDKVGSVVDPILLTGTPWWAWTSFFMETPRSCTISVVGDTLYYNVASVPGSVIYFEPLIRIIYGAR